MQCGSCASVRRGGTKPKSSVLGVAAIAVFQSSPIHFTWIKRPFPAHLLQPFYFMLHFHLSGFGVEFTHTGWRTSPTSRTLTFQLVQLQVLQFLPQVFNELWACKQAMSLPSLHNQPTPAAAISVLHLCILTEALWAWLRLDSPTIQPLALLWKHRSLKPLQSWKWLSSLSFSLRGIIPLANIVKKMLGNTFKTASSQRVVNPLGQGLPFIRYSCSIHYPTGTPLIETQCSNTFTGCCICSVHPVCPFFFRWASMQMRCDCLVLHPSSHLPPVWLPSPC